LKSCYSTPLFYVANATACFALAEPLPIIDRNVVRVYRRVFGEEFPETEHDQERFAADLLPGDGDTARTFNMVPLDFGATVCTKSNHLCDSCFANEYCA